MKRVGSVLFLAILVGLGVIACQQPAVDDGAANKDLVRQFYAAIDNNDLAKRGTLLADDCVLGFAGVPEPLGKKAFFELLSGVFRAFPDYTHQVDEMVADGDRVAVKVTYHATHRGEYEGIPATGKVITYNGAHFFTVANGRIQRAWALEDNMALMTQLGMALAPAPQKRRARRPCVACAPLRTRGRRRYPLDPEGQGAAPVASAHHATYRRGAVSGDNLSTGRSS